MLVKNLNQMNMKNLITVFAIFALASCQSVEPLYTENIIVGKEDSCLVETTPDILSRWKWQPEVTYSMKRVPPGMKAFYYATPEEMAEGRLREKWLVDSAKAHYVGDTIYVKK